MKNLRSLILCSVGLAWLVPGAGQAATLILPNAAATTEGNASVPPGGNRTFQNQVAASELSGMPVGSSITGLSLRLNGGGATGPSATVTFSDFEITLAQAANAIGSLSSTLANNMTSPQLVRDGALSVAANSITGGSNPNPFAWNLTFDTPYTYQGGDLVYMLSWPTPTGTLGNLDIATSSLGIGTVVNGKFDFSFRATTSGSSGFIPAQISFTAVPEPGETALAAGAGLLGLVVWRRRARRVA